MEEQHNDSILMLVAEEPMLGIFERIVETCFSAANLGHTQARSIITSIVASAGSYQLTRVWHRNTVY